MSPRWPLARVGTALLALLGAAAPAGAHNGESGSGSAPRVPPTLGPPAAGPQEPVHPAAPRPTPTTGGVGEGWRRWWASQAHLLAPRRGPVVTGGGPGDPGSSPPPKGRTIEDATGIEVVPTLLWALAPRRDFDTNVVCACHLALGKVARRASEVEVLFDAAVRTDTADGEAATAVLALGLLRRSTPEARFDGATIARARRTLLHVLDDEKMPTNTRSTAALSLGLLADQGCDAPDPVARDLFDRLRASWAADEIPISIVVALSRYPAEALGSDVLEGLRRLALTGAGTARRAGDALRAHALVAWALATPSPSPPVLLSTVVSARAGDGPRLGATVALGLRASALPTPLRVEAARRVRAVTEAQTARAGLRPVGWIALARLAAADVADRSGHVLEDAGVADALVEALEDRHLDARPYALFALALAGRRVEPAPEVRSWAELRTRALKRLRELARDDGGAAESKGAYLVALGLLDDESSSPMFCERTRPGSGAETPRGWACEALGLLGRASPPALTALGDVAGEARGDGWVRSKAVEALGRMGAARDAAVRLGEELGTRGPTWRVAHLATALGASGRVEAVEPLVRCVHDAATKDDVRAAACAALGRLCDPEPAPSVTRVLEAVAELPGNAAVAGLLEGL